MTEEIKFEKAMEKLEKIVEDLESGNVELEEALKKYEEGVKLSRLCRQRLTQAEKKIQVLTKSLDGNFQKEPFETEDEETVNKPPRSRAKTSSRAQESNDGEGEDLLI